MLFDLCVVGGGLFGSAAARHASANPTLNVVLIGPDEPNNEEYKSREIFSCHYDEGRITRVLDENAAYEELAKESISRYQELENLSGIKFYNPVGFLSVGERNSPVMSELHKEAVFGKVPILALSNEQLKVRYPYLEFKPREVSFLDENGAGYISARKMVKAQKEVAKQQGCTILSDIVTKVSSQQHSKELGVFHEVLTEKGNVICAKRVLVCAGAFTKYKDLIPHEKKINCTTNQETAVLLKIPSEEAERLQSMPSIVYHGTDSSDEKMSTYILPPNRYPNNDYYLKIGHVEDYGVQLHTLEEIKKWYNSKGSEHIIKRYSKKLMDMLPNLRVEEVKAFTCVCCYSPSGIPYIDRVVPTVAVAFAGNGKGAKISDEVGRIAAQLSVYGKWDSSLPKSLFEVVWEE